MTAKSRSRKVEAPIRTYLFPTSTKDVLVDARTVKRAKEMFQETYGYWPDADPIIVQHH